MKKVSSIFVLSILVAANCFAQSTTLTLPTSDNTSSFDVLKNNATNVLKVRGDGKVGMGQSSPRAQLEVGGTDGILCTGTVNSGTATALGSGLRFHWYPRKGAFRVGVAETTYWDDDGSSYPKLALYSIAMGYQPRATGVASTAIGAYNYSTGDYTLTLGSYCQASGTHSIAIGTQAIASGIYSIAIGSGCSTNGKDGAMVIGDDTFNANTNASADNEMSMRFVNGYRFFTKSDNTIGVSVVPGGSSWTTISDSTKKTNFRNANGEYFLNSLSKLKLGSWNYKLQNPKEYRHYGPMAQEIFHYFGKDELGVIGNDTSLASADMDGIVMICLKALEKRTTELKKAGDKIAELEKALSGQNTKIKSQQNMMEEIAKKFTAIESRLNAFENSNAQLSLVNSQQKKGGAGK